MYSNLPSKDYKGKRGALYLRVSTEDQRRNYSYLFQERDGRALLDQLGMLLNVSPL